MFIFSYVLIANWILGIGILHLMKNYASEILNFTLFGTPFRFSVLHSLIPFHYLPAEQLIVVSRDAVFLEKEFLKEGGKGRKIMLDEESFKEAI